MKEDPVMPAPPIMDLGSGMNTQQVIQKLLEIEKQPMQRLEQNNAKTEVIVDAWKEVRNRARNLEMKSQSLYSFSGPFARKRVISSDPDAITGEAASHVEDIKEKIEVLELATHHQLNSAPVADDRTIAPGNFIIRVGEKEVNVNFTGGKIEDLFDVIREKAESSEAFEAYRIRSDMNHSLIGLRSKKIGKGGEIRFEDPDGILQNIGMIRKLTPDEREAKPLSLTKQSFHLYSGRHYKSGNSGQYHFDEKQALLSMNDDSAVEMGVKLEADQSLIFHVKSSAKQNDSAEKSGEQRDDSNPAPGQKRISRKESITVGPQIGVEIEGVRLEGYQIDREREKTVIAPDYKNLGNENEQPEAQNPIKGAGIGLVWMEGNEEKSTIIPMDPGGETAQGSGDLDLEREIHPGEITGGVAPEKIFFYSVDGRKLEISRFRTAKSAGEGMTAANETTPAKDARIKLNGVEITRPGNENLTDIMDGVKINLHRTTTKEEDLMVQADSDEIIKTINDWVKAYNELMAFLRENSKAATEEDFRMHRPTDDKKNIGGGLDAMDTIKGIFATDSTVRSLVSVMRDRTSSAYPARFEPGYRILSDIGISTGSATDSWDEIKHGYLKVDEQKLRVALSKSPKSVKELFVSDQNLDARPDNGVAFSLTKSLQPFTRVSGGLITARIDLLKNQMTSNKEELRRMQLSLESKEENLRMKFGRMESAVRSNRAMGSYMKNNLGSAGEK